MSWAVCGASMLACIQLMVAVLFYSAPTASLLDYSAHALRAHSVHQHFDPLLRKIQLVLHFRDLFPQQLHFIHLTLNLLIHLSLICLLTILNSARRRIHIHLKKQALSTRQRHSSSLRWRAAYSATICAFCVLFIYSATFTESISN